MSTPELSGELSTAIMLQRSDLEFIKTISCISGSYYISNLKTIGTDLEEVIFNGFLSQIKDLKLLLCVFHLQ